MRLLDGPLGVPGEAGETSDADEAVLAAGREVHGREHIARRAHVFDDETVEDLRRVQALAGELSIGSS